MMYVEFIDQPHNVPDEVFRFLGAQSAWSDPDDDLLGQISSCKGLGPFPSHMAFCRFSAFSRLDQWEAHFRSPAHASDLRIHAKHKAIEHWRAGCYEEIVKAGRPLNSPFYYVEFIKPESRSARLGRDRLLLMLAPIGGLAPLGADLAVWDLDTLDQGNKLLDAGSEGLTSAGVYRDFSSS